MIERRIYSSYAFSENEREKGKTNYEIYKELQDKAQVIHQSQLENITDEMKNQKAYILDYQHGYGHTKYKVISNPFNLSTLELALVADGGNLCFGYRTEGNLIVIHTD